MTRRVLVTGGASGIGSALARRFAGEGARVAVCDRDPAAVAEFSDAAPGIRAFEADVTDAASMGAMFEALDAEWGGVDVLCANAGTGGPVGPVETLSLEDWRACLSVNLDGAFLACRWAAAHMKREGAGVILITSSVSGLFGFPNRSPYVAAKWGLIGLTKTLAAELGPHGVRVNAICPGAVEGPRMERVLTAEAAARGVEVDEMRRLYTAGTSLRSWVTAEDVADCAAFLASPAAARITGQAIPVDGNTENTTA
jgi:NAD(P)-dependent dehydrogenase (short-subunit alcohol dehydrogenase family)